MARRKHPGGSAHPETPRDDLFTRAAEERARRQAPLAERMRPRTLDEFVGQEHLVGPGRLLRRAIEADRLGSIILWGPPGSGKTTLARIIARTTRAHFEPLNAVTAGVADLRRVIEEARERQAVEGRSTVLFVDEVHRWNRAQQDALLPHLESGLVSLIGATTENPYFACVPPLVSRARIFRLEPLSDDHVRRLLRRALEDRERGLGMYRVEVEPAALEHLVRVAGGDARTALNALELAVLTTPPDADGVRRITLSVAEESIQRRALAYDPTGDEHYDHMSALIKSIRGSDPDAAVYWLARMLYAGEDPRTIVRRLLVHAAEDVGLADPRALQVAAAAATAVEQVGMPEARIPLAEAVLYLATAPKSNAVIKAIDAAWKAVEEQAIRGVPRHLRDAHYRGARTLGHGQGYRYPHDYPGHFVRQQYLPDELLGARFYEPSDQGYEGRLAAVIEARRGPTGRFPAARDPARGGRTAAPEEPGPADGPSAAVAPPSGDRRRDRGPSRGAGAGDPEAPSAAGGAETSSRGGDARPSGTGEAVAFGAAGAEVPGTGGAEAAGGRDAAAPPATGAAGTLPAARDAGTASAAREE
ncbi:AAA family ATPase [Thermaerobacter sp. FW80]|uniref:AAA family ATPase n=1 Tax=Thermaerobacter sp. FW80 TaxID=2546351 RepID=UPI0026BA308F